jgi:hypothetical protein
MMPVLIYPEMSKRGSGYETTSEKKKKKKGEIPERADGGGSVGNNGSFLHVCPADGGEQHRGNEYGKQYDRINVW